MTLSHSIADPKRLIASLLCIALWAAQSSSFVLPSQAKGCSRLSSNWCRLKAETTNVASPTSEADHLKSKLISAISTFRTVLERDSMNNDFSVDFGVKGGELNETSRAPSNIDFYRVSETAGAAAQNVMNIANDLTQYNPTLEPTAFLGNATFGHLAPLNGEWRLLFTTAADATFTKNSKRGSAKVGNVVDGRKGTIRNVIDFDNPDSPLKQLNVKIRGNVLSATRVELDFRYAKAILTKFLFIFRDVPLYIPVPAAFITKLIIWKGKLSNLFRREKREVKPPPKGYFDVTYLDANLRIHKTGEGNIFVQCRQSWADAAPLLN